MGRAGPSGAAPTKPPAKATVSKVAAEPKVKKEAITSPKPKAAAAKPTPAKPAPASKSKYFNDDEEEDDDIEMTDIKPAPDSDIKAEPAAVAVTGKRGVAAVVLKKEAKKRAARCIVVDGSDEDDISLQVSSSPAACPAAVPVKRPVVSAGATPGDSLQGRDSQRCLQPLQKQQPPVVAGGATAAPEKPIAGQSSVLARGSLHTSVACAAARQSEPAPGPAETLPIRKENHSQQPLLNLPVPNQSLDTSSKHQHNSVRGTEVPEEIHHTHIHTHIHNHITPQDTTGSHNGGSSRHDLPARGHAGNENGRARERERTSEHPSRDRDRRDGYGHESEYLPSRDRDRRDDYGHESEYVPSRDRDSICSHTEAAARSSKRHRSPVRSRAPSPPRGSRPYARLPDRKRNQPSKQALSHQARDRETHRSGTDPASDVRKQAVSDRDQRSNYKPCNNKHRLSEKQLSKQRKEAAD
ncbi:MAG: hypothetical protein WDW38_004523 [Sanguina aurantia]